MDALLDRYRAFRDRRLASDAFRRWAARFPLTRPIARRRAMALFDLCTGFVHAQVLTACVRLRVFDTLADGPLMPAELARRIGVPLDRGTRLFDAAVVLRLLERRRARIGLGPHGAALIDNAPAVAMIEHHALLYDDLRDPVALFRSDAPTRLGTWWAYARQQDGHAIDPAHAADYSRLMAASQALVRDELLACGDFEHARRVVDIGGGDGTFAAVLARAYPTLDVRTFDLAPVAALAAQRFEREGLAPRARAVAGDFRHDPLPRDADTFVLSRVVHDHDDAIVDALFRSVRAALPAGGRLIVAEPMAATPGAETVGDAYFGVYLLAMGQGRPRSASRLREMLTASGFASVCLARNPSPWHARVLIARTDVAHRSVNLS